MEDLPQLKARLNELNEKLSDPEFFSQTDKLIAAQKEIKNLEQEISERERLAELEKQIGDADEIIRTETDAELLKIAEDEKGKLEREKEALLKLHVKQEKIIMEIRPGAGGEEASLFAAELLRMYLRYFERKNFSYQILNTAYTELGGLREATVEVRGPEVYQILQYEAGVHRVQRIPETEKSGRIQTSTASVAVFFSPDKKDLVIDPKDIRVDVYRASGPGGQLVNKRESAVRITYLPENIIVASQEERTQASNKENAMAILRAKLYQLFKEREEAAMSKTLKEQIGRRERSMKIRTYNFPQSRITDHRVKKSWSNVTAIMEGDLDNMINEIRTDLTQEQK